MEATNFGSHIDISAPGIKMYGPGPCCAAVVVVGAVLFGWNRRAVALKQLHRDSSLPMPEGDVEVSAD